MFRSPADMTPNAKGMTRHTSSFSRLPLSSLVVKNSLQSRTSRFALRVQTTSSDTIRSTGSIRPQPQPSHRRGTVLICPSRSQWESSVEEEE